MISLQTTTFGRKLGKSGEGIRGPKEGFKTATPIWPLEISITRLAWNDANGIGRAGMLASGSASGLCRIDFMQGYKDGAKLKGLEGKVADANRKAARKAPTTVKKSRKGEVRDESDEDDDDYDDHNEDGEDL